MGSKMYLQTWAVCCFFLLLLADLCAAVCSLLKQPVRQEPDYFRKRKIFLNVIQITAWYGHLSVLWIRIRIPIMDPDLRIKT